MRLKPGTREQYISRHAAVWPDLLSALKAHGVSNYSIFLHESDMLFAYAEIESEELWNRIAETAECQNWWLHMKTLMLANDDNSPVTEALQEVFHLD